MKKKIFFPIFILSQFLSHFSSAQDYYSILAWSTVYPTGELNDFIDKSSFRGFGFEFGKGINDNFAVGLIASWNVFYEASDYDTYVMGNLTISGKQYRYINAFPIMITGHYFISPGSRINPYVAGGIGTYRMNKKTDIGLYTSVNNNWHFGFFPEAGLFFNITDDFALNLTARYNYVSKVSQSPSYSYLNLVLGFAFLY
ncbi:outer membrane beta-barrel protein [Bacteroidota bacterium]